VSGDATGYQEPELLQPPSPAVVQVRVTVAPAFVIVNVFVDFEPATIV
jgi:hypothetical protein